MTPGVLLSAVLMKCETRGQQAGVVVGMVIFAIALLAVSYWFFSIGDAARQTLPQFEARDRFGYYQDQRQRNDLYQLMVIWYALSGLVALITPILAWVGFVNFIRLVTNTGLKDPDTL